MNKLLDNTKVSNGVITVNNVKGRVIKEIGLMVVLSVAWQNKKRD
ncbi:hypothetical protein FACS189413_11720 [Bacteroidia bacterium]|nr:hypothetical protein FACS189413_11720 [Bacteroidia bacterium]